MHPLTVDPLISGVVHSTIHCGLVWVPERTVEEPTTMETTMRAKHNDTRSCRPVPLRNAILDVVDDDAQWFTVVGTHIA